MHTWQKVLIYGAGGHGKVIAEAARAQGWSSIFFADDRPDKRGLIFAGSTVVATGFQETVDFCKNNKAEVILAIGDNRIRAKLFADFIRAGVHIGTVIHPKAYIAPAVVVGVGTVVFAGVVINIDSKIGENVIINTSVSLDHDNIIANHVHVSPGAHTGGTVTIGEGTHIGLGSSLRNNIDIGAWTVIGAGSVVVKNIPDQVVAFGNPARVVRENRA